jgi:hypothetical protein
MRTVFSGHVFLVFSGLIGCSEPSVVPVDCGEASIAACPVPWIPNFKQVHLGAEWSLVAAEHGAVEVGFATDLEAGTPLSWSTGETVTFEELGRVQVFSRYPEIDGCESTLLTRVIDVVSDYGVGDPAAGRVGVPAHHPLIESWATEVIAVTYGEEVDSSWRNSEAALGPAEGSPDEVLVLGEGGELSLGFSRPIRDDEGPDFVVFENSTAAGFLELAFVEVSTDGEHFIRFPSAYLGEGPIGTFGTHSPDGISGLAGRHQAGFGTPFDLDVLKQHPLVQDGLVDLQRIEQLRIVDVVGDGSVLDSFGMPIYDPYPSVGTAGFDLDAVGVINSLPSVCLE